MLRFLTQPLNWKQTRVKRKSEQKKLDHKNKIEKEKVFDEYIFPGILRSLIAKGVLRWEYFFYIKRKIFSRNIPPGLIILSMLYAQHTYAVRQGRASQRDTRPHVHATQTKERAD